MVMSGISFFHGDSYKSISQMHWCWACIKYVP